MWPQADHPDVHRAPAAQQLPLRRRRDWDAIAKALKPVYTAASEAAALDAFAEFSGTWEAKYPAIVKLWENAWAEFVPFLRLRPGDPDADLHDQRDRVAQRPVPPLGQGPRPLPDRAGRPQVPLPRHHQPRPDRPGPAALESNRWKAALNAFDITFDGRLSAGRK